MRTTNTAQHAPTQHTVATSEAQTWLVRSAKGVFKGVCLTAGSLVGSAACFWTGATGAGRATGRMRGAVLLFLRSVLSAQQQESGACQLMRSLASAP